MVRICQGSNICLDVNNPTVLHLPDGDINLRDFMSTRLPWTSMMGDVKPLNLVTDIGFGRNMPSPDYAIVTVWYPGIGSTFDLRVYVRFQDISNSYYARYYYDTSTGTKYLQINKVVAGTVTTLASTSITYSDPFLVLFEAEGSTLNLYTSTDFSTFNLLLTATDTSITSPGMAVVKHLGAGTRGLIGVWFKTDLPMSPRLEPKSFYLVKVTGKGTDEDPYRPNITPVVSKPKTVVLNKYVYNLINKISTLSDNDKNYLLKALGVIQDVSEDLSELAYTSVMPVDESGDLFSDEAVVGIIDINEDYRSKVLSNAKPISFAESEEKMRKYLERQRKSNRSKK